MINIALVGASGKMGQALIRESLNDKAVQVTNYLVNDGSKFLGSDVGAVSYTHLTLPTKA